MRNRFVRISGRKHFVVLNARKRKTTRILAELLVFFQNLGERDKQIFAVRDGKDLLVIFAARMSAKRAKNQAKCHDKRRSRFRR